MPMRNCIRRPSSTSALYAVIAFWNGNGALDRVHDAAEFRQDAITSGVDHATAVARDRGKHDRQVILEVANGAHLVGTPPSARCSRQCRRRESPPSRGKRSDFCSAPTCGVFQAAPTSTQRKVCSLVRHGAARMGKISSDKRMEFGIFNQVAAARPRLHPADRTQPTTLIN
jgi:hypothetical protein